MVRAARWAGWVRCCSGVPAHRGRGRDPSAASWCKGQTAFLHLPTLLHNSSTCASICICSCFVRLQVSASFFLKTPVWEMSDKAKIWLPSKKSSAELCYDTHSTEHTKCCQWAAGTGTTKHTDGGGTHQIVTLGCRSPELNIPTNEGLHWAVVLGVPAAHPGQLLFGMLCPNGAPGGCHLLPCTPICRRELREEPHPYREGNRCCWRHFSPGCSVIFVNAY